MMSLTYPYNEMSECVDHPLGILCRCREYREIADKFVIYAVGTSNPWKVDKNDIKEPIASAKVVWELQKAEANANPTKPVLHYTNLTNITDEKVDENIVDKKWIPVNVNFVSTNELRPNESYRHRTAQNTQSAEISVLTDMLPHRGRTIKRKDIDWDIGSHATPVKMTDKPETNFSNAKGCFSTWASAYTLATGNPAY